MAETLREYVDSRGLALRVDREAGVLRGVKLIGLHSQNGRRYRASALAAAVSLYESAKVNVNHASEGTFQPRDYRDRLGVIRNAEYRAEEGLFGDLHFNPKHVLAEQLIWDAEHNPSNVGFSHNVLARVSREGQSVVVEEITRVQSVDLVADPAATRGLFEHQVPTADVASKSFWDGLTIELLVRHRPDVCTALESKARQSVERELSELRLAEQSRRNEERIAQILAELAPQSRFETCTPRKALGDSFYEMLLTISDDNQVRQLIHERVETWPKAEANDLQDSYFPHSIEQNAPLVGSRVIANSAEFARAVQGAGI